MNKVATLLLCVCFITVLFPQPGYIHPDEFFQSSEIVAGDILQVDHTRAWEFNSTFPIRSVVFPYLLTAPPLYLLRWMNSTCFTGFRISTVKVVMATRLPVAFLNVFGYLATGRLAGHFGVEKYISTNLWCSSYVFWSYYTRTFSNSVETFLLAMIFLLTLSSPSLIRVRHRKNTASDSKNDDDKSEGTKSSGELSTDSDSKRTVKSSSNKTVLEDDKMSKGIHHVVKIKSFLLGVLISAGFFNRPTFLLFSAMPVMYWCLCVLRNRRSFDRIMLVVTIKLYALLGAFLVSIAFISFDSLYYKADFMEMLTKLCNDVVENSFSIERMTSNLKMLFSSCVITPLNFLHYNMDSNNLAKHGLHPRYTHFLVNVPLLIGPLFIPFLTVCISSFYLCLRRGMKGSYASTLWLVLMALVPVFGLSIFPHQEARFLIPLLPVFIVTGAKVVSVMSRGRKIFVIMWVVFNLVLHLIYGYFHQAALIPVLSAYQQKLSTSLSRPHKQMPLADHMIFYRTYPPPRHLLLLPESHSGVQIHDLAGSHFKVLMKLVNGLEREMQKPNVNTRAYIFLPSTVSRRISDHLVGRELSVSTSSMCPHLSTEALPRFKDFATKRITFDDFLMDFCLNVIQVNRKDMLQRM